MLEPWASDMSAAEIPLPDLCPRVIGSSYDGRRLVTCGHTMPCPYHGEPIVRIVPPPADGGAEQ